MTPDETFRCPNCRREYKTVAGFKRHLLTHVDPREARQYATMAQECPVCGAEPLEECSLRNGTMMGTATHFQRNPRNRQS